jgi:hypothetical protein
MRHRLLIVLVASGLCGSASSVGAQGFIVPFVGTTFEGSAPSGKTTYGVAAGATAAGLFGAEVEFGHTPRFFDDGSDLRNVVTLNADLLVGVPLGGFRPYGVIGAGLIRQRRDISVDGVLSQVTDNEFGYNVGGGVVLRLAPLIGLRADVRRFKVRQSGGLSFGRASIGLYIG